MSERIEDVGIILSGSVDAGKSTLTAVLLTGKLDTDKKKPLRNLVAKHPHERELGRTSDISTNVLHLNNKKYTFIDLCGHEKYLGTTTFGMTGYFPDFAILAVAANRGILPMTKEHMGLLITLKIPIIITITREDLAQKSIYDKIHKLLRGIANRYHKKIRRINLPMITMIENERDSIIEHIKELYVEDIANGKLNINALEKKLDDIIKTYKMYDVLPEAKTYDDEVLEKSIEFFVRKNEDEASRTIAHDAKELVENPHYWPIITVSNKTGYYINVLRTLIASLTPRNKWANIQEVEQANEKAEKKNSIFYIDAVYTPKNAPGIVVTGILRGDNLNAGDDYYLGPYNKGLVKVKVKTLRDSDDEPTMTLQDNDRGGIAISAKDIKLEKKVIRKGMILTFNEAYNNNICYEFEADVEILHHPTTITSRFTAVIHCGGIKQTARIIIPNDRTLRTEDKERVRFRFLKMPECMEIGRVFCFRGGNTIGFGTVTDFLSIHSDPKGPEELKRKRFHRRRNRGLQKDQVKV